MEVAATAQQGAVAPGAQIDWQEAAETVVEGSGDWKMGNAGVEAEAAAAGGAAEYGPGAPPATTHGSVAEVFYDGAECDVDTGNAAEASAPTAATAAGVRPPRPSNWSAMTKDQKRHWYKRRVKRR